MLMRCLLDTHTLLWARSAPDRLSADAVAALQSPSNVLYISVASLWECAIKSSIGKLDIPKNFFEDAAATANSCSFEHRAFHPLPLLTATAQAPRLVAESLRRRSISTAASSRRRFCLPNRLAQNAASSGNLRTQQDQLRGENRIHAGAGDQARH